MCRDETADADRGEQTRVEDGTRSINENCCLK